MQPILKALGRPLFLLSRERRQIDFINGPGEELLGASAGEVLGKDWKAYFDDTSIRRIDALMQILEDQIRLNGENVEGRQELQLTLRRRTGRPVIVNLIVTPIEDRGRGYWLFDLEDLSPILDLQKEKEELVAEMSRVAKLADIGRLTGGIAHELNNPLAILQGLLENIEMSIESGELDEDSLRRDLEPMQETITRMIRIIQSMMGVARGEQPQMESLALQEIWTRAASGFRGFNQFSGIDVRVNLDPKIVLSVDSIRIEQVLINLVKNALYSLQSVPLEHRILDVTSEERSGEVRLIVSDHGPGVPADAVANLFTPFFTTKPVGKGTGLGLFLCYNIMKAHGGTLSYQPRPGGGASFILTFPKSLVRVPFSNAV